MGEAYVEELIEFFQELPLLVAENVASQTRAVLVALVELMHVAEIGEKIGRAHV